MHRLRLEKKIFKDGFKRIGGIDEAGRGPLAGPVVAACLSIAPSFRIKNKGLIGVNDSKLLSEKKREELFKMLMDEDLEIGIGICSPRIIDKVNIFQATFLAMKKSIEKLSSRPEYIILDGKFPIPKLEIGQRAIVKGDATVFLIAAASIIAKVTRDRLMRKYHGQFPGYGFERHKGYATRHHCRMIKRLGPCPIHRRTFSPVRAVLGRSLVVDLP